MIGTEADLSTTSTREWPASSLVQRCRSHCTTIAMVFFVIKKSSTAGLAQDWPPGQRGGRLLVARRIRESNVFLDLDLSVVA